MPAEITDQEKLIVNKLREIVKIGFGDLTVRVRKGKIVEVEKKQVEKLEELKVA